VVTYIVSEHIDQTNKVDYKVAYDKCSRSHMVPGSFGSIQRNIVQACTHCTETGACADDSTKIHHSSLVQGL
jgi:hypothetical protein